MQSAASPLPHDYTVSRPSLDCRIHAPSPSAVFSTPGQLPSAQLIRILLLRAGIEQNPGPTPWFCGGCTSRIYRYHQSVECVQCLAWLHFRKTRNNCSGLPVLTNRTARGYVCPTCRGPQTSTAANTPLALPALTARPAGMARPTSLVPSLLAVPVSSAMQAPSAGLALLAQRDRRSVRRLPTLRNVQPSNQPIPSVLVDSSSTSTSPSLNILQFNCNGLLGRLEELKAFLFEHNIKVAVLQETKLSPTSRLSSIPGFSVLRKDRARNSGGGLVTLIHYSIPFTELPSSSPDDVCELQHVKLNLDTPLDIINVYIPPSSSCPSGYRPSVGHLLSGTSRLVLGDFNAHDALWCSATSCARGGAISDEINESSFGTLNEDGSHTRLPSAGNASSPDISIASCDILASTTWSTHCTLGSDHLPITISLLTSSATYTVPRRTFLNLRKADWSGFEELIDDALAHEELPTDINKGIAVFNAAVIRAAKRHIPAGRIPHFQPGLPREAVTLASSRDQLRAVDPTNPQVMELGRLVDKTIADHRRDRWREHVSSFSIHDNPALLWGTIRNLSQCSPRTENQSISFEGIHLNGSSTIADEFNRQFTSVRLHQSNKGSRIIRRKVLKRSLESPLTVTTTETAAAIKAARNSKAMGPDNISMLYLKHLGPAAVAYLTHLFNLSLSTCTIPAIWKTSIICPLPKAGKDLAISTNYRPISLLCPAVKVLERLILPTLNYHLPLQSHQHGFRPLHSTTTALHLLTDHVACGFNKPKPPDRTILVALDLSKAFDSVDIDSLTASLDQTLPGYLSRWFSAYLRGRQSKVAFRNTTSKCRNVKTGVPQGAVTSPSLFNFYLSDLPAPPVGVQVLSYADDISILASGPSVQPLCDCLNSYLNVLSSYFISKFLTVNVAKSTVTLFTPDSHQYNFHPQLFLEDQLLPLERYPRILGVTLDPLLTLNRHASAQAVTAKKRTNILKALAGTTWGQDEETLTTTYRAIGKSVLEYAAPVIFPLLSDTSWTKLERAENAALRVVTGCTAMAGSDHLHQETQLLPVRQHCQLLSDQYLRRSLLPAHPAHHLLSRQPPRRYLKRTLADDSRAARGPLSIPPVTTTECNAMVASLHRQAVAAAIAQRAANRVLGTPPPQVNTRILERRALLTRRVRAALSQLRSGFSPLLFSYRARMPGLYPGATNSCPDCHQSPHDVNHLFNCPSHPTTLRPLDLWFRPAEVATFLRLDPP